MSKKEKSEIRVALELLCKAFCNVGDCPMEVIDKDSVCNLTDCERCYTEKINKLENENGKCK